MASGVALRESVKEMKRLKNEPLLMLAIIAIILSLDSSWYTR